MTGDIERYVDALAASWSGLVSAHPDGRVVRSDAFVAACSVHPVWNNALLLAADALPEVRACYPSGTAYAVWTWFGQPAPAGFRRDVTTCAVQCDLDGQRVEDSGQTVERDVDPAVVADGNGLPADALRDVPDLRCYAAGRGASVLMVQDCGRDAVISCVATQAGQRGRGLSAATLAAALADAAGRGLRGACLQATSMAENGYRRAGFRALGRWQEWLPPAP